MGENNFAKAELSCSLFLIKRLFYSEGVVIMRNNLLNYFMKTTKVLLVGMTAAFVLVTPTFAKKDNSKKADKAEKVEKAEKGNKGEKAEKAKGKGGVLAGLSKDEKKAMIKRFDADKDGKLNKEERAEMRKVLKKEEQQAKKGKGDKKEKKNKKGKKKNAE